LRDSTKIVTSGRHPELYQGAVNPPVFRASSVLSQTMAEWEHKAAERAKDVPGMYYGRNGTPTTRALEEAFADLEGGYRSFVYPSGLAACVTAILAYVKAGDHILFTDSVYGPVRRLAGSFLDRFGVSSTFYDPLIGDGIASLIQPNTRVVYTEAPGSHTFEFQDIPAIAKAAHAADAVVVMDNTWATPLYYRAFEHGVDVSVQAATKYVVGHSDAMLGIVTVNRDHYDALKACTYELGQIASPDDVYLALRGMRTMHVRLPRHWETGLKLARWIAEQPEVEVVIHPALEGDPGHALWKRDCTGASGLFTFVLKPVGDGARAALIDNLKYFNVGASWGGYESLILPINPSKVRTATTWPYAGPAFRIHAGLESADDLLEDLTHGFECLRAFQV